MPIYAVSPIKPHIHCPKILVHLGLSENKVPIHWMIILFPFKKKTHLEVIDQLVYQIAIDTARLAPLSEQQADARLSLWGQVFFQAGIVMLQLQGFM